MEVNTLRYEDSMANINKVGKKSIILELNPKFQPFLDGLSNCLADGLEPGMVYNVLAVLAGECCEGDYIVTTDESTDYDLDALVQCIREHEWEEFPSRHELELILKHFDECLWKRTVTWG